MDCNEIKSDQSSMSSTISELESMIANDGNQTGLKK